MPKLLSIVSEMSSRVFQCECFRFLWDLFFYFFLEHKFDLLDSKTVKDLCVFLSKSENSTHSPDHDGPYVDVLVLKFLYFGA